MRLLPHYQETIKKYFVEFFENGEVYLFGSRVDDNKKGGDIDLYFVLKNHSNLFEKKMHEIMKEEIQIGI